jgi:hypothetical protein
MAITPLREVAPRPKRIAMFDRSQKQDRPPLGAIEFEPTDFEAARQVLDELPAGLDPTHGDPTYWLTRRRPPTASDRALTGRALDWMVTLPEALRPQQLSRQYPRITNTLAALWTDRPEALQALEGLLIDRRGGRRGLPDAVRSELQALQRHLTPGTETATPPPAAPPREHAALARARQLLEAAGYRVIPPAS